MHEMAITSNVVDVVLDYAEKHNATRVARIDLVVGELRDIVDHLMEGAFRHLARETIARDAKLNIQKVSLRVRCKECGVVFPANLHDPKTLACPDCQSTNISIFNGREFLIKSIEIET